MANRSIETVREFVKGEIFSDTDLAAAFPDRRIREGRLQRMVKRGEIIRLKRGLFAFSGTYRRAPVSTYYLANILRGPSYVSLESALSFYNLIPEAVYAMTSVTYLRTSSYKTPLGFFSYRLIPKKAFPYGVTVHEQGTVKFLIASKEKALVDKLYLDCKQNDFFDVVVNSLRIAEEDIKALNLKAVAELSSLYNNKRFSKRIEFFVERATI